MSKLSFKRGASLRWMSDVPMSLSHSHGRLDLSRDFFDKKLSCKNGPGLKFLNFYDILKLLHKGIESEKNKIDMKSHNMRKNICLIF